MSPLIHAERDPYLYCPPVVQVPDGMTADEARQILDAARADAIAEAHLIDDLATDLRKAWDATSGLARYPVSDPVWGDLARVAIERVRAGA